MPNQLPTIRIFISSPADVRPERLKAEQIIARLDREFTYHFRVEAVLWERQPLVAAHHFQDPENISPPRGSRWSGGSERWRIRCRFAELGAALRAKARGCRIGVAARGALQGLRRAALRTEAALARNILAATRAGFG